MVVSSSHDSGGEDEGRILLKLLTGLGCPVGSTPRPRALTTNRTIGYVAFPMTIRAGLGLALLASALPLGSLPAAAQRGARPEQRIGVELGLAERRIVLKPGLSDILTLPRPAKTIIIGNPSIVDATLNGDQAMVLTGQRAGETNLIILGQDNTEMVRAAVRVGTAPPQKVEVRNGVQIQSYSCSPACRPDASTTTTSYTGPFGTTTAVTTTGDLPPDLVTPPGAPPVAPAPSAGAAAAAGAPPAAPPVR